MKHQRACFASSGNPFSRKNTKLLKPWFFQRVQSYQLLTLIKEPLFTAFVIVFGNPSLMLLQTLINLGMNIDAQDKFGNSPLHTAMKLGELWSKHAGALLLSNGAKANINNEDGVIPIQMALMSGDVETVEIFLQKEEDVQNIDEAKRSQHLIKRLLEESNDLYISSKNYSALLHFLVI